MANNGYSIRPAGKSAASLSDLIDLDDIFQDDFFPPELDFTSIMSQDNAVGGFGLDGGNNFPGMASGYMPTDMENILNMSMDGPFHPPGQFIPSVPALPGDSSKAIKIPPAMPHGIQIPAPKTSKAAAKQKEKKKAALEAEKKQLAEESQLLKQGNSKKRSKGDISEEDGSGEDDYGSSDGEGGGDDQRKQRRERNRQHARRSRIRKRVLLDTLQDQLEALRDVNTKLRRIIANRMPQQATDILASCTTAESSLLATLDEDPAQEGLYGDKKPKGSRLTSKIASSIVQSHAAAANSAVVPTAPPKQQARILMEPDYRLVHSLITSQQNFVLSDPSLPDNPIVYVSDGFLRLTGYKRQDVLGRNCRFLQGPGTDQAAVDLIRQGVRDGRDISVCLLNYRADGSAFWNQFFLGALKDSDGQVVNYVGVQCEVNSIPVTEIKDRVKKLPMPDAL